jgi:hypothetical protein
VRNGPSAQRCKDVGTRLLKPTVCRRWVGGALGLLLVTLALPVSGTALPPVAEFTFTPATPRIGEQVSFSSQSTDGDSGPGGEHGDGDSGPGGAPPTVPPQIPPTVTPQIPTVPPQIPATVPPQIPTVPPQIPATVPPQIPTVPPQIPATVAPQIPTVPLQAPAAATRRPSLLLSPFPIVHIRGTLVGGWIRLQLLSVLAPRGARIDLRCSGVTCPVRGVVRVARMGGTPVRFPMMERRRLRAGVVIRIAVTKQDRIGKYTRFVLRRNAPPARRDMCMRYGATRPSACPVQ